MIRSGYEDRLPFVLPDFTRVAWVSDHASDVWGPRIRQIAGAWSQVERHSVLEGVRPCFLSRMPVEELLANAPVWVRHGLAVLPLKQEGMVNGYRAAPVPSGAGDRDGLLTVVGRPEDTARFHAAWTSHDHDAMGRLLGYPSCCRSFFDDIWVKRQCVDTTWQMAAAASGPDVRSVRVGGPVEANILWRWMGLRLVPHLPCDFACAATVEFGKALRQVADALGVGEQIALLDEILDWPVQWTALHGIAEIKTPVCKIVTRTDATATRYAVEREGDRYPAEGADGLGFPYRKRLRVGPIPISIELKNPSSTRPRASPENTSPETAPAETASPEGVGVDARADDEYRDNGFQSLSAMRRLHAPIVKAAISCLGESEGNIADLGCGNGALLRAIASRAPGRLRGFGVEIDPAKVRRSFAILEGTDIDLVSGDLFEVDRWAAGRRYLLSLLAASRLTEVSPDEARAFHSRLSRYSKKLLLYSYPDRPRDSVERALAVLRLQAHHADESVAVVELHDETSG
ncbi:hypothetical protein [Sphaerisporangium perillae]|uniref:hypothetical protein n=1 Tax=Sphaerisporangium perillae TaxID=2935860 RepID=UPI00200C358D|nr:hypothetical protein [Sphaerisporangium perillae]